MVEEAAGEDGDGGVEVKQKRCLWDVVSNSLEEENGAVTYYFPETALFGVAVFRVSLPAVVDLLCQARFGNNGLVGSFCGCHLATYFHILWCVLEVLFVFAFVRFRLIYECLQTGKDTLQFS